MELVLAVKQCKAFVNEFKYAAISVFLLQFIGTFLISNADESSNYWSRVRRSPDSERIQRWKLAFSGGNYDMFNLLSESNLQI